MHSPSSYRLLAAQGHHAGSQGELHRAGWAASVAICRQVSIAEPYRRSGVEARMWRLIALAPMFGFLVLLACAKQDPVADNALAPSDELVGDASASGLAAPANAAAAEAAQQAALPSATGGLRWAYRTADRAAEFGPPAPRPFRSSAIGSARATASWSSSASFPRLSVRKGRSALPATAKSRRYRWPGCTNPNRIGGQWRATVSVGDIARDVAETFSGPGAVNVTISGLPALVVPASPEPRRVFAECLG